MGLWRGDGVDVSPGRGIWRFGTEPAESPKVTLVDLEIVPEPSPEERRAIVLALRLEEVGHVAPTPWRGAGLGPEEEDQAAAPVRQSRGAARA